MSSTKTSAPAMARPALPAGVGTVQSRRNLVVGVIYGLATALVWAGWAVATRFAMTTTLEPHDVTLLRYGVSGLFLWPLLFRTGLGLQQIGVVRMVVMVVGAGAPFMLVASNGINFAPASHVATLMQGAMPLFVAIMAVVLFGQRFDRPQTIGFAAVVLGIACIGGHALLFNRAEGEWRGDLLFLLGGNLFAAYTLAQRRSGISSWHAVALVSVISTIGFAPFYFLFYDSNLLTAPWQEVLFQAFAQGIGIAMLGLWFYGEAVRRLGAPHGAIFGSLVPGLASLMAAPLLGEIPGPSTIVGIVLVSLGVVLVSGIASLRNKPSS